MGMSKKDKYFKQLKEAQDKKDLLDSYLRGGHKVPTTRRQFLASGLLSATSTLLAPTLPTLISRTAWAQEVGCPDDETSASGNPVFVHLQLAGGAALFANSLSCLADGQPFNNYARLGMGSQPPRGNFFANNAPFWVASDTSAGSPIFTQMFSSLGDDNMDIVNQSAFVQVCAESLDDTRNNPQDITGMLQAAGISGSQLPYLSAGENNRFQSAILPSANMLRSNNAAAIEGSLQFTGALGSFRGNNQQIADVHGALAQLIENLNKYQVEQLARTPSSHESQKIFRQLVQCASTKNTSLQGQAPVVDIFDANFPGGSDLADIWSVLRNNDL
ncbi:MAG: hypothetical protein HRT44_09015, partial [Bdellovibrionales bacterium]|nr:hypothetical protein [Bdellovibrionales bacterium]NQZ19380.1 hypothetical protein [Bdellovibrionales bacterium]